MSGFKLFVFDLDNTLYDWADYFVHAFYAMAGEASAIMGCDMDDLLDDFREVHIAHHDSEHPFALLDTDVVKNSFPGMARREIAEILDPAFHAFNVERKKRLKLYPDVEEVLRIISQTECRIVAHTESKKFSAIDRLARLNLGNFFDKIFCRESLFSSHPFPERIKGDMNQTILQKIYELPQAQRKPDPSVLLKICRNQGVAIEKSAYIGDSMNRDVLMAREAGVFSIWAKYGSKVPDETYRKLVRISHWTKEDIDRERALTSISRSLIPDLTLENGIREVLSVF